MSVVCQWMTTKCSKNAVNKKNIERVIIIFPNFLESEKLFVELFNSGHNFPGVQLNPSKIWEMKFQYCEVNMNETATKNGIVVSKLKLLSYQYIEVISHVLKKYQTSAIILFAFATRIFCSSHLFIISEMD